MRVFLPPAACASPRRCASTTWCLGCCRRRWRGWRRWVASGAVVITYISTSELGETGRVVVANPVSGGSGGSAHLDGISGSDLSVAFLRNVPVEVLESEAPGAGASLRLAAGYRRRRQASRRLWHGIRSADPPSQRCRGDARQGSAPLLCLGGCGWYAPTPSGNTAVRPGQPPHDIGKQTVYRPAMNEVIRSGAAAAVAGAIRWNAIPCWWCRMWRRDCVAVDRARSSMAWRWPTAPCRQKKRGHSDRNHDGAAHRAGQRSILVRDAANGKSTYGIAAEQIATWLPTLAEGVRRHAQAEVYHQLRRQDPGPYDAAATQQAMQIVETKLPKAGRLHHE